MAAGRGWDVHNGVFIELPKSVRRAGPHQGPPSESVSLRTTS
jgi:hypothetical protein